MVQVPEEPKDELYTFLMEHREWICSLIQADQPGWDDCLFSSLRRVLEYPRPGVDNGVVHEPVPQHPLGDCGPDNGGVPKPDPQHPRDDVEQDPKADQ